MANIYRYAELAGMIDHSLLHPMLTDDELRDGCGLALEYEVASVCIKPYAVELAAKLLRGSQVAVGTVVGFPHGGNLPEIKRRETRRACEQGATEIDLVINIGKARSRDWDYVAQDILEVADEAHNHGALVKVIFENDFLDDDSLKIELCQICERAGADYIKTSTGFGFVRQEGGSYNYRGATDADLILMHANTSPHVKLKAAGGVRTLEDLLRIRELGVDRCGTSATRAILDVCRQTEI